MQALGHAPNVVTGSAAAARGGDESGDVLSDANRELLDAMATRGIEPPAAIRYVYHAAIAKVKSKKRNYGAIFRNDEEE